MKLLTTEIVNRFKKHGSQDGKGDQAIVCLKLFDPCSQWTWYATEAWLVLRDGRQILVGDETVKREEVEDIHFFGYVVGLEREWGYFSLAELSTSKNKMGLGVERDMHFKPVPAREIIEGRTR